MKRRKFIAGLAGAAAWPVVARGQHRDKIPRVGFMGNSTAALEANLIGPFHEGLREHGYEEGRNVEIVFRWAEGRYERFPALIVNLAAKMDVIVTAGTPAMLAVKKATATVPVVMCSGRGRGHQCACGPLPSPKLVVVAHTTRARVYLRSSRLSGRRA